MATGIKSLVNKFEQTASYEKLSANNLQVVKGGVERAHQRAPSDASSHDDMTLSSKELVPTTNGTTSATLEQEINKHQITQAKLDNVTHKLRSADKEISELRRQNERLLQKMSKLSTVFNDFKGVMEDEPLTRTRSDSLSSAPSGSSQRGNLLRKATNGTFQSPPVPKPTLYIQPNQTPTPPTTPTAGASESFDSSSGAVTADSVVEIVVSSSPKVPPQVPPRYTFNTNSQPAFAVAPPSPQPQSLRPHSGVFLSPPTSTDPPTSPRLSHSGSTKQKMLDLHDHTIEQFLKTQKSYCNNLQLIVEVFLQPLREEVRNSTDPFISQANVQQIFSHIEVILGFSKLLVQVLETRVDNPARPLLIGDVFFQATDYFKLYTPYIAGYCQAFTVLNKCKADNPRFLAFIRERERKIESKFKDLGSLLVLPVMRISQYTHFLEEVLETTPDDMSDSEPLKEALKKMKSVVEYVKEKTLDYESHNKVQQVQSMLIGKFANLNVPHRRYVMEGVLMELTTNREYHCFLFNDIQFITKNKLEHRSTIDLLHMEVACPHDPEERPVFTISPTATAPTNSTLLYNPLSQSSSLKGELNKGTFLDGLGLSSSPNANSPSMHPTHPTSPLSSSTSSTAPPHLMFCASSQRDKDTWVAELTEAIEQEKAIEKNKLKSSSDRNSTAVPIGSGGLIDFEKSHIEVQELIAQGGSGCKIHRCTVDGYTCVAKILNVSEKSQEVVAPFVREIMIIEQLRHPSIAKYLGHRFTKNNNRMWLFMEYCPFSLEKILERRKGVLFPAKEVAWIGLEIAKGIEFLHSQSIIHRDLKCGNILCNLDENNEVKNLKITDFDTSKIVSQKGMMLHTCIGTTSFMAPEVLDVHNSTAEGYTLKADIFSFGMLLVEVISLNPPYHQYESIRVAELVLDGKRPELPPNLTPEMAPIVKFIHQCTEFNPENRPSASQCVSALTKLFHSLTHSLVKDKAR